MTNVVRHEQKRTKLGDNSPSKYVTELSDNILKNKFGEIRLKYRKQGITNVQNFWKVITFRYFFQLKSKSFFSKIKYLTMIYIF